MSKPKYIVTSVLGYVFSFFMFLLAIFIVLLTFFRITIGSNLFLTNGVESSQYTEITIQSIYDNLNESAAIAGISQEDFFNDVISRDIIASDIKNYFAESLDGQTPDFNTGAVEAKIESAVRDYLSTQDTSELTEEELEENISDFVDVCVSEYKSMVVVNYLPEAGKMIRLFDKPINIGIPVLAVLLALVAFVTYLICKSRRRFLDYCIISLTGVLVLMAAVAIYIYFSNIIGRLGIGSLALFSIVETIVVKMLYSMLIIASIIIVVLAILVLIRRIFSEEHIQLEIKH